MGLRAASSEKRRWYRTLWSHTVAHSRKHCSTLWWHCSGTQWRTLVAHSGGSTVRPQRAICLFSHFCLSILCLFLQSANCKSVWCPVYQTSVYQTGVWCTKHCTCAAKLLRLLKSLRVPGFADFLASHCCFNVSKDPREHSRHQNANWI